MTSAVGGFKSSIVKVCSTAKEEPARAVSTACTLQ